MKTIPIIAATFVAMTVALKAATLYGPTPYLQQSDSPFATEIQLGIVALETFEDNLFNIPGVTASAGSVIGPNGLTDSVDADDGTIDGNGNNGRSFFSNNGSAGIRFTFTGILPTKAGLVWTDGASTVSFQAFDQDGVSLGVFPTHLADGVNFGETAEDRFYGAENATGISSILIRNSTGGIEVDHLQFGAPVPEPASVALLLFGGALCLWSRTRRAQQRNT